ncbi:cytochrome c [Lysobacter ciconiae]|uniref:Cytochrome c n=1 Tax=Novilysobacter ciconiae TaxID=2781022 RepID=A0A7S6UHZ0_9GAMM|nr:cytochrome c [Lysobacter ciconiae]QOW20574.1 cytochrome c [Lysobacter ciconiae]
MDNPQRETPYGDHKPHGNGAKYIILVLVGLAIGVLATVMLLRALEGRKTWQDHFPGAAMHMMEAHAAQLGGKIKANRCSAPDSQPHIKALRTVSDDLEPAFPGLADDARFAGHAGDLRATLDAALASPAEGCESLAATTKKIGENCKACHQDFR